MMTLYRNSPVRKLFEPEADQSLEHDLSNRGEDVLYMRSIAISLRRIADSLENRKDVVVVHDIQQ